MAVTYPTNVKNNRLKMVFLAGSVTPASGDNVDANSSYGVLVIGTSALSGATGVIATITLQKPSVSIASGVATILGTPLSATASLAGTNTAAKAEIRDSAGNVVISGLTVGTSGSDINLNSTSITQGQTVTLTSGTITHA